MTNLEQIKAKVEELQTLTNIFLVDTGNLEVRKRVLDQQERDNRLFEKDLLVKEEQLAIREEEQKKEKEFVEEANRKLAVHEMNATDDKQLLKDINEAKDEFEKRKQEALTQEKLVQVRIKKVEEWSKAVDDREAIVDKSNAIDIERKRLLDVREARIRAREQQLQMEATE